MAGLEPPDRMESMIASSCCLCLCRQERQVPVSPVFVSLPTDRRRLHALQQPNKCRQRFDSFQKAVKHLLHPSGACARHLPFRICPRNARANATGIDNAREIQHHCPPGIDCLMLRCGESFPRLGVTADPRAPRPADQTAITHVDRTSLPFRWQPRPLCLQIGPVPGRSTNSGIPGAITGVRYVQRCGHAAAPCVGARAPRLRLPRPKSLRRGGNRAHDV